MGHKPSGAPKPKPVSSPSEMIKVKLSEWGFLPEKAHYVKEIGYSLGINHN